MMPYIITAFWLLKDALCATKYNDCLVDDNS